MRSTSLDADRTGPLWVAVAIAGGTLAYADPVRFDNDGSFAWTDDVFLDLTKPAEEQTGQPSPGRASFQYARVTSTCCIGRLNFRVIGATPDSQMEGYPTASARFAGATFPDDVGDQWSSSRLLAYYYADGAGFYTQFSGFPEYAAVRFDIDGATHYGWLSLVTRGYVGPPPNRIFELLAWGFETDPNTPIVAGAVPSPSGALALLAFGAAAGATRARRG